MLRERLWVNMRRCWCLCGESASEVPACGSQLTRYRVRPPNTTEQRRGESESVWGTDEWNPQTIKLGPGQGRENRDWTFGTSCDTTEIVALEIVYSSPDRILDTDTDNSRAYAMSAKTHVRREYTSLHMDVLS